MCIMHSSQHLIMLTHILHINSRFGTQFQAIWTVRQDNQGKCSQNLIQSTLNIPIKIITQVNLLLLFYHNKTTVHCQWLAVLPLLFPLFHTCIHSHRCWEHNPHSCSKTVSTTIFIMDLPQNIFKYWYQSWQSNTPPLELRSTYQNQAVH